MVSGSKKFVLKSLAQRYNNIINRNGMFSRFIYVPAC
jgi:hypothetical protein